MKQTPILNTARLTIRPLREDDHHAIFKIRSNADIAAHLDRPIHTELHETERFIQKILQNQGVQSHYWAIDAGDDSCVGTICLWNFNPTQLSCDIGYEIHPDFQGKGLAKEAISRVVAFGFDEEGILHMEGWVAPENTVSIHILKTLGFVFQREEEGLSVFVQTTSK